MNIRCLAMTACVTIFSITGFAAEPVGTFIDNFEDGIARWRVTPPTSAREENETVHEGRRALRFDMEVRTKCLLPLETTDWSGYGALSFWMYAPRATGGIVGIGLDSENSESDGWVYFYHLIPLDWEGWKWIVIPKADFKHSRGPTWEVVRSIFFSTTDWSDMTNLEPEGYFIVDDMRLLTVEEATVAGE